MNFQGLSAKYRHLYDESAAWRLLRVDNAPFILAFISDLFSESSEVPYSHARMLLDEEIQQSRSLGLWKTEIRAKTYLNQWLAQGWLREMDGMLVTTDAVETVLKFSRGVDERTVTTTASHLRVVQDAVRDFAVAINENVDDRIESLEQKKSEIQSEIDSLNAGVVSYLNEQQRRERVREIYQLSSQLTGDFRLLEEEIRHFDKEIRIKMINDETTRGTLLSRVFEKEALLAETDAGNAFDGFFELLCDNSRMMEFREQLHEILSSNVASYLAPEQYQLLADLLKELSYESERVFKIRRKTEQALRFYIENGAVVENRTVDKLISDIEKVAVELRNADCSLNTPTSLSIDVGPVEVRSPDSMRLRQPQEKLDTGQAVAHENSHRPSTQMLSSLESVKVREVAEKLNELLDDSRSQSLKELIEQLPISKGLEELIAFLRVAKSVSGNEIDAQEVVVITDTKGAQLRATVPKILLTASMFPDDLDTLVL